MNIIERIKLRAIEGDKTIVLPESMDKRVVEASAIVVREGIANVILIGDVEEVKKHGVDISGVTVINPSTYEYTEKFINMFFDMRKEKGLSLEEARNLILNDYMYFACMLVYCGYADGVVSGACHSTSNTFRPALQILKTKEDVKLASAFFLMVVPDCEYGDNGTFLFADSGMVQNPSAEELCYIAGVSAESFELLTEHKAVVGMLSHSTMGSASHEDVDKVVMATKMAREVFPEYEIDGEFQLDAAIVPEVGKIKAPNSNVAGRANVLIFPDLDAGNIGYKLVQRLGKAEAYGPISQGIAKPVNDLSRGASVEDIVGVVAITVVQAL